MVITQPTIDDFSDTTVMRVIRKIVNYICSDSGLVAQINDNDITGFTSSYKDNVLKIDATKGDGSTIPVCNLTIQGGSGTSNPYPTAVNGTVGVDGNIKFTITMSSGSPLTTTINMKYFASADGLSDLQEQVSGIKPTVTTNLKTSPPTITVAVNGTSSTANLPSGGGSAIEIVKVYKNLEVPVYFNVSAMQSGTVQALTIDVDNEAVRNIVIGSVDGDNLINILYPIGTSGGSYYKCGYNTRDYGYSSDVNIPKESIISDFKSVIANKKTGTYTVRYGSDDDSTSVSVITDKITINVTMDGATANCTISESTVKIYSDNNITGNTRTKILPQSITYVG